MTIDTSARLGLPLLAAGQAQKEQWHNEALAMLDLATGATVIAAGVNDPPDDPAGGACWIVGDQPTGAWAGAAGELAGWTSGGWRFVAAPPGLAVWDAGSGLTLRKLASGWSDGAEQVSAVVIGGQQVVGGRQPAIGAPTGGATVDEEARAALLAILAALRLHGLIG